MSFGWPTMWLVCAVRPVRCSYGFAQLPVKMLPRTLSGSRRRHGKPRVIEKVRDSGPLTRIHLQHLSNQVNELLGILLRMNVFVTVLLP